MTRDEMNIGLKILIEQLAERLERMISRVDPRHLENLDGPAGMIVNFILHTVPPELTAVALNYLGEVINRRIRDRHAVGALVAEEGLERIGIGLRNLAEAARAGNRPTREQLIGAVRQTAEEAHTAVPNMEQLPSVERELSIYETWSMPMILALAGFEHALDQETGSDDTDARDHGDNDGNGLEGFAFRVKRGLKIWLNKNPDAVHRILENTQLMRDYQPGDDTFTAMLNNPYNNGRVLIRMCISHSDEGSDGFLPSFSKHWATFRDFLDKQFDRDTVRNVLVMLSLGATWLGMKSLTIASVIGLLLAFVVICGVVVIEFLLCILFVHALGQLMHGFGIRETASFFGIFKVFWGSGWQIPPAPMQLSYVMAGLASFALWRFLFTPLSSLTELILKGLRAINPLRVGSVLNTPFKALWTWIQIKTGVNVAYRQAMDVQGRRAPEEVLPSTPWARRIGITFNLIFIVIADVYIFAFGLHATAFKEFGLMYAVSCTIVSAGLTLYFTLELMGLSPYHWSRSERKTMAHKTMWALVRVGIAFLAIGLLGIGGLGVTRSSWAGYSTMSVHDQQPSSSPSTAASSGLTEKQQRKCAHFQDRPELLPDYCN